MSERAARKWPLVAVTALLTAAVAFPAGLWLSANRAPERREVAVAVSPRASAAAPPAAQAKVRDVYTARIASDPYVVGQQRAVVEAMERSCAHLGEGCREAAKARNYIDRQTTAE